MELSIVIPVYNESKYIDKFIPELIHKLNRQKFNYELIISENGSRDDTLVKSKRLKKRFTKLKLISSRKANYGLAVKNGFLSAKGKYLVLFDLDYWDIQFLIKAIPQMKMNDAIIGAKRGRGSKDNRTIIRKMSTFIFSSILKIFFGMKISDTHGIKILNRRKFLPLIKKCKMTKEIFDSELLIRGERSGLKIGEIGVKVIEKRSSRTSIIKRAIRTIKDLYKLKQHLDKEYAKLPRL